MCTVCEDHESGKGQKAKGKEKKVQGERKQYQRSVRVSKQTAMPCPTPNLGKERVVVKGIIV